MIIKQVFKHSLYASIIVGSTVHAQAIQRSVDSGLLSSHEPRSDPSASGTEAITVIGESLFGDTSKISPTSVVSAEELSFTNITTTEDAIAYEPGLVVRRRFIGDPNGVIGLRGSNEFQGSRSMVFVDGMPVHYHLQTRWNGSPRWSLVSPSEIAQAQVVYGPFSAEYSGNAMGGVVNIQTKTPTQSRTRIEAQLFSQDYEVLSTSENFMGSRVFVSNENRIGDFNYFLSYNRLDNDGQPQTQFFANSEEGVSLLAQTGFIRGVDSRGDAVVYYGDSGVEATQTDLVKLKLGYEIENLQLRANVAYEQRERGQQAPNNYLRDQNGNPIWGSFSLPGDPGVSYSTSSFGTSAFQQRTQERDSLLVGLGLSGQLSNDYELDVFYSRFDILEDVEIRSGANSLDPDFRAVNEGFRGRLTEIDNTGWDILDVKIGTQELAGNSDARLSFGVHYDSYALEVNPFRYNSISAERGRSRGSSGGQASTKAAFLQFGYGLNDTWDVALGLRYEDWTSSESFSGDALVGKRSESGFSPKLSIARFFGDDHTVRYSVARALRFPIVEELYRNESSGARVFDGNAALSPEDGLHHNLSWERQLENGVLKVNLFWEEVEDTIFSFSANNANGQSISTALPVDEVTTKGLELIYNQRALFDSRFDLRFNATFVDASVTKNRLNPELVGKQFPRIPEARVNVLLTYHLSDVVNLSTGGRYSSDSFNELDNSDTASNVFGARDDYFFVNLKANWQVSAKFTLGLGVDNVFNDEAYVAHPWPARTVFANASLEF